MTTAATAGTAIVTYDARKNNSNCILKVLVNQFAIVRNDQYFDDAETFNPDRFLGKEAEGVPSEISRSMRTANARGRERMRG